MPSDCHVKFNQSLKRKTILKIRNVFFRGAYVYSVDIKMKPQRINIFELIQKPARILLRSRKKQPVYFLFIG